jgi:hypothetical protein
LRKNGRDARSNERRQGQAYAQGPVVEALEVLRGAWQVSAVNFYSPDEREIVAEIRAWSSYALEKVSPFFNGLPPCPYAKKAWQDNRVAVVFRYGGNQCLFNVLSEFSDALDLVLIVDQNTRQSSDDFHEFLENMNQAISNGIFGDRDLWLMGFHPDDDANDFLDDGSLSPTSTHRIA